MKRRSLNVACAIALATPVIAMAEVDIGKLYTGDIHRIQQKHVDQDSADLLSRNEIRLAGMRMFTNPFTKEQGFGDGNDDPPSATPGSNHEGERGTLQDNGTFQRINGLDAQTCLECHSIISRRQVPMVFGIGGVGGVNNTVLGAGGATFVDLNLSGNSGGDQKQNINGRVINPPFIFGAGGIELLAKEMTIRLNRLLKNTGPNETTALRAKGIDFGSVSKDSDGNIVTVDHDNNPATEEVAVGVEGVFDTRPRVYVNNVLVDNNDFLVVAPFGRKGDNKSTRTFDTGALSFHFGMAVDGGNDHDNDGVRNEVTEGELSALSIFVATAQTPFQTELSARARHGRRIMNEVGCTECHKPRMNTHSKFLTFSADEKGNDPAHAIYYSTDLTRPPMNFPENDKGGITVELFADLKRHYMGPSLAEFNGDAMFTTMRLWGVADTAPYLHDGRALTIRDAIELHGADDSSEANPAVSAFLARSARDQEAVLAFLDTLRSPSGVFPGLQRLAKDVAHAQGVE